MKILNMTPETGAKHSRTGKKPDCLAPHPKKLFNQENTSREEKNYNSLVNDPTKNYVYHCRIL